MGASLSHQNLASVPAHCFRYLTSFILSPVECGILRPILELPMDSPMGSDSGPALSPLRGNAILSVLPGCPLNLPSGFDSGY